jgi:hypothetical protein
MDHHAQGSFDVNLTPQPADHPDLGRLTIAKQYHGDLEATAEGQMLTAMTAVDGSAGYVAIERVSGTLGGRQGTFVLQHAGLMDRGAQRLTVTVVPDSATGSLAGLRGDLSIRITEEGHFYTFDYDLPATA